MKKIMCLLFILCNVAFTFSQQITSMAEAEKYIISAIEKNNKQVKSDSKVEYFYTADLSTYGKIYFKSKQECTNFADTMKQAQRKFKKLSTYDVKDDIYDKVIKILTVNNLTQEANTKYRSPPEPPVVKPNEPTNTTGGSGDSRTSTTGKTKPGELVVKPQQNNQAQSPKLNNWGGISTNPPANDLDADDKNRQKKEVELALINELIKIGFDTTGVDISKYDPGLKYCGTGAFYNENERGFWERNFVPQISNFACFIHDYQYGILNYSKKDADVNFLKNTYLEAKERLTNLSEPEYSKLITDLKIHCEEIYMRRGGRCPYNNDELIDMEAHKLSDKYYIGVKLFAGSAYKDAQIKPQSEAYINTILNPVVGILPRFENNSVYLPERQKNDEIYFVLPHKKEEGISLANELLPKAEEKLVAYDKNMEILNLQYKNTENEYSQLIREKQKQLLMDEYKKDISLYYGGNDKIHIAAIEEKLKSDFDMPEENLQTIRNEIVDNVIQADWRKMSSDDGKTSIDNSKTIGLLESLANDNGQKAADARLEGRLIDLQSGYKKEAEKTKQELNELVQKKAQSLNQILISQQKLIAEKENIQKVKNHYNNVIQNGKIVVTAQNEIDTMNLGNILNQVINQ